MNVRGEIFAAWENRERFEGLSFGGGAGGDNRFCQRRRFLKQRSFELGERRWRTLYEDLDRAGIVPHPAVQPKPVREPINKRTKTHALHAPGDKPFLRLKEGCRIYGIGQGHIDVLIFAPCRLSLQNAKKALPGTDLSASHIILFRALTQETAGLG
jgi:hypothetical protein